MRSDSVNINGVFFNPTNNSVLTIDSARPFTNEFKLEWFGLTNTCKWVPINVGDNPINSFEYLFITRRVPVHIIGPSVIGPAFKHLRLRQASCVV